MSDSTETTRRDQELEDIVVAYYEAHEQGNPISRDELLRRYPQFTKELTEFLDGQARLNPFAKTSDATPTYSANVPRLAVPRLPMQFGDFELLEEIAQGGMGTVYRARQVSLNRVVALKMISAGAFANPTDIERFRAEGEAVAQLDHPNIVPIYEVGELEGRHFFTMKFVEGGSLANVLAGKRWLPSDRDAERRSARLISAIARAVHYAHQRGILHRDLKPGNVLLSGQWSVVSGQPGNSNVSSLATDDKPLATGNIVPYVTDFGLAKRLEGGSDLTQSGAIVGTPSYMAPEQAGGQKQLTTAADVYSLGAILYELLTGQKAFQADAPLATLMLVQKHEPVKPSALVPGVSKDLEVIALKCLEKDPRSRYASAEALADDLDRWLNHEPIQARAAPAWDQCARWLKRHPALTATLVMIGLVSVVGFAVVTAKWREAEGALNNAKEQAEAAEKDRIEAEEALKIAITSREGMTIGSMQVMAFLNAQKLSMAELLARRNQKDHARRELQGCFPRGWEWHHVSRLCEDVPCVFEREGFGALAFKDAKTLATLDRERHIVLWNPRGKRADTIERPFGTTNLIHIREPACWVMGDSQGQVLLFDIEKGEEVARFQETKSPVACLATAGTLLGAGHTDGTIAVWELKDKKKSWSAKQASEVTAMALRADGLVVTAGKDKHTRFWEAGRITEDSLHPAAAAAMAFSPNGKDFVQAIAEGLYFRELATSRKFHSAATAPIRCIAYSPDGSRLATGCADHVVHIFDLSGLKTPGETVVRTATRVYGLYDLTAPIEKVTFSPDGALLAGLTKGRVMVWDGEPMR